MDTAMTDLVATATTVESVSRRKSVQQVMTTEVQEEKQVTETVRINTNQINGLRERIEGIEGSIYDRVKKAVDSAFVPIKKDMEGIKSQFETIDQYLKGQSPQDQAYRKEMDELKAQQEQMESRLKDVADVNLRKNIDRVLTDKIKQNPALIQPNSMTPRTTRASLSLFAERPSSIRSSMSTNNIGSVGIIQKIHTMEENINDIKKKISEINDNSGMMMAHDSTIKELSARQDDLNEEMERMMEMKAQLQESRNSVFTQYQEIEDLRKLLSSNKIPEDLIDMIKQTPTKLEEFEQKIIQGDMKELQSRIDRLQQQTVKKKDNEEAIADLITRITKIENDSTQIMEIKDRMESTTKTLESMGETVSCLEDELQKAMDHTWILEEVHGILSNNETVNQLSAKVKSQEATVTNDKAKLSYVETDIRRMVKDINDMNATLASSVQSSNYELEMRTVKEDIDDIKASVEKIQAQVIPGTEGSLERLTKLNESLEEIDNLKAQYDDLSQLKDLSKEIYVLRELVTALKKNETESKKEKESLMRQLTTQEAMIQGLQIQMSEPINCSTTKEDEPSLREEMTQELNDIRMKLDQLTQARREIKMESRENKRVIEQRLNEIAHTIETQIQTTSSERITEMADVKQTVLNLERAYQENRKLEEDLDCKIAEIGRANENSEVLCTLKRQVDGLQNAISGLSATQEKGQTQSDGQNAQIIRIQENITEIQEAYQSSLKESENLKIELNTKIEEVLNRPQSTPIDHTKDLEELRKQVSDCREEITTLNNSYQTLSELSKSTKEGFERKFEEVSHSGMEETKEEYTQISKELADIREDCVRLTERLGAVEAKDLDEIEIHNKDCMSWCYDFMVLFLIPVIFAIFNFLLLTNKYGDDNYRK